MKASSIPSGCQFGQHMVNQGPRFDNQVKKSRRKNGNQVISKAGIIRGDKRYRTRFL